MGRSLSISASPDDTPPAPDGPDRQHSPSAIYITLLSDHDQGAAAGQPLLTGAGVRRIQQLLDGERAGHHPVPYRAEVPRWDEVGRRLYLGDRTLREFHRPAPAQTALLAAFDRAGWPAGPVEDPLPPDPGEAPDEHRRRLDEHRRRLKETVKNLNKEMPAGTLHFREDRGMVWWERVPGGPDT